MMVKEFADGVLVEGVFAERHTAAKSWGDFGGGADSTDDVGGLEAETWVCACYKDSSASEGGGRNWGR